MTKREKLRILLNFQQLWEEFMFTDTIDGSDAIWMITGKEEREYFLGGECFCWMLVSSCGFSIVSLMKLAEI